ncbi:MAG: ComF family protein [Candidatus Eremiobacteraeota bacterium]|nr:ComF family protein [Candidatus Eremiobacteraeota bacterium]
MLKAFLEGLLDLVFPRHCCACGKISDQSLCVSCFSRSEYLSPPFCRRCGIPMEQAGLCDDCSIRNPSYEKAMSACSYEGVTRKAVISLKFRHNQDLAPILALLMMKRLQQEGGLPRIDCLVPVPLSQAGEKQRGFNQAFLLAAPISEALHIPIRQDILRKKRETSSLKKLARKERFLTVSGSFELIDGNALKGATVLLIDDIMTTGATLEECAATLKQGGALGVFCLTLARTLPHRHRDILHS